MATLEGGVIMLLLISGEEIAQIDGIMSDVRGVEQVSKETHKGRYVIERCFIFYSIRYVAALGAMQRSLYYSSGCHRVLRSI
jgi:hypothetical protein